MPPPAAPTAIELRDADPSDLAILIETTSQAYRADPLLRYFVRADERQGDGLRRLLDFCLREQALPHGHVSMIPDGSGCAAWLPPTKAGASISLLEQLLLLPRMVRICSAARVPRLLATMRLLERHHPTAPPHHYLYLLAVLPERQQQGLGSALLQAGLRSIDRAGAATYLETASERNLAFYRRHGFVVTGEARLPFDGPKLWFLWREPQAG